MIQCYINHYDIEISYPTINIKKFKKYFIKIKQRIVLFINMR